MGSRKGHTRTAVVVTAVSFSPVRGAVCLPARDEHACEIGRRRLRGVSVRIRVRLGTGGVAACGRGTPEQRRAHAMVWVRTAWGAWTVCIAVRCARTFLETGVSLLMALRSTSRTGGSACSAMGCSAFAGGISAAIVICSAVLVACVQRSMQQRAPRQQAARRSRGKLTQRELCAAGDRRAEAIWTCRSSSGAATHGAASADRMASLRGSRVDARCRLGLRTQRRWWRRECRRMRSVQSIGPVMAPIGAQGWGMTVRSHGVRERGVSQGASWGSHRA